MSISSTEHEALWSHNKSKFHLNQHHRDQKYKHKSKTKWVLHLASSCNKQSLLPGKSFMSEMCATDVKAAHFSCLQSAKETFAKANPAWHGSLHQSPVDLIPLTLVPTRFSLKSQLRSACSCSVTTHFSLTLCKCLYFHVSCQIQNGKVLLRVTQNLTVSAKK